MSDHTPMPTLPSGFEQADERLENLMKLIHEAFRRLVRVHAVLVADKRGKE